MSNFVDFLAFYVKIMFIRSIFAQFNLEEYSQDCQTVGVMTSFWKIAVFVVVMDHVDLSRVSTNGNATVLFPVIFLSHYILLY